MPRYEFKDGKSNKFWEIELEEESFTTRWGRIGTEGQETTKDFDSKAEARKEYEKLIAEKVKKGYVLVDAGDGAAPSKRNAELEAAILANLDSDEGFLVYGDWLQANGDPRGELVALQASIASGTADESARSREAELLQKVRESDFGMDAKAVRDDDEAAVQATYRLGFVDRVRVGFMNYEDWEDNDGDVEFGVVLSSLMKRPGGAFVREVVIGMPEFEGETNFEPVVREMVKVGPYAALRTLHVGHFEFPEQTEISWTTVGDMGKVWAAFPNLERVELQGGAIKLGKIDAPKLRHLELRTGGLPKGALKSIASGNLPSLEVLRVWTGDENYGADGAFADVRPILEGKNLPKVTTLGIMNCEYTDEVAAALPKAAILPQLRVLDLSMGTLSDEGGRALLAHREAFAHLTELNLGDNFLNETVQELSSWPNVVIGSQRTPYDGDERYVSVGE